MFFVVGPVLLYLPFVFILLYISINYFVKGKNSVCIVVLGDLGRSPRMLYHTSSFAKEGFHVDLVGYGGSKLPDSIRRNKDIRKYLLPDVPAFLKYCPRLLVFILKVIFQSITLGVTLLFSPKAGFIMIQNPPCIPTLAVCWLVCWLRGSKLVIDWHNYGYTILSLGVGEQHTLVKIAKWYEFFFGRFSAVNFCVTNAMRTDLSSLGISANTLYDKAPEEFKKTPVEDKHKLLLKLSETYDIFVPDKKPEKYKEETVLTVKQSDGKIVNRQDRPAFLISSTSWTEDEDFGVLLQTLHEYEIAADTKDNKLPDVVCVITGKGPQKEYYKEKIEKAEWKHVKICLPWLESEDYPVLLGSADLGVCLHTSSSGLDLPMKVVDMFGCGVPVCAIDYNCISELVQHNHNGLVFSNSKHLLQQIKILLDDFHTGQKRLTEMREKLEIFQAIRWHESWKKTVLPLFTSEKLKVH
ncbi:chitobiosyldiphosphodolichol beta-mannosyltransferase-like [Mytilus trossulus]|uniref:chitobiosyldiphosphodolichol beta-mannosyltransferase-like n=1 Tax=Mytilus trossulus TaxID=6551 RepID=UPI0030062AEB